MCVFYFAISEGIFRLIVIQVPSHSSLAMREHAFHSIPIGYFRFRNSFNFFSALTTSFLLSLAIWWTFLSVATIVLLFCVREVWLSKWEYLHCEDRSALFLSQYMYHIASYMYPVSFKLHTLIASYTRHTSVSYEAHMTSFMVVSYGIIYGHAP